MKPLVSILIPCYNAEAWLVETLESALAQTWTNKEIIVVDDGSKDRSWEIAKEFEPRGVKVLRQQNLGASAARNLALQEAQGEFIQYLDADDLLAPDKIERQIKLLSREGNSGLVASGEWARFFNSPSEANFISEPVWRDLSPVDWLVCSWKGGGMMHPAAWLVPRLIAETAGLWNEDLSVNDDGEYFCRVLLASQGVKFCWGAKTYYRSGNFNSLSGSKSPAAWESAFRSLELGTSNLLAKENSQRTRYICARVFQKFIYEVYPDVPDLRKQAGAKVQQLGGSDLKPLGGPMFQLLSQFVGWKQSKRIQKLVYRDGYRKAAIGWRLAMLIQRSSCYAKKGINDIS
jgi:glycosyltransferase involved in cell wall biosynthesis